MSAKVIPLADQVAEVWKQVEALPPSEERAKLQVTLGHAATRLARRICGEGGGEEAMSAINLTPEPGDELVRMKNSGNSDQLNLGTHAFFPDHRKAFWIPAKDAGRVLSEPGGFISPRCPNRRGFRT